MSDPTHLTSDYYLKSIKVLIVKPIKLHRPSRSATKRTLAVGASLVPWPDRVCVSGLDFRWTRGRGREGCLQA